MRCEECQHFWQKTSPLKQDVNENYSITTKVEECYCRRFPRTEHVTREYYCGEFKQKVETTLEHIMAKEKKNARAKD